MNPDVAFEIVNLAVSRMVQILELLEIIGGRAIGPIRPFREREFFWMWLSGLYCTIVTLSGTV
jgi:hypothetical protein